MVRDAFKGNRTIFTTTENHVPDFTSKPLGACYTIGHKRHVKVKPDENVFRTFLFKEGSRREGIVCPPVISASADANGPEV